VGRDDQRGFAEDLEHLRLNGLRSAALQQLEDRSTRDKNEVHIPLETLVVGSEGFPQDALHPIPVDGGAYTL
jgi:hypothetical protein